MRNYVLLQQQVENLLNPVSNIWKYKANAIVENKPRADNLAKTPVAKPNGQTNWVIAAPNVQTTGSPGKKGKYLPTTNSAKPCGS